MKPYEPEIGQMCFGQPWQRYEASNLLIAALREIGNRLDRLMWNLEQKQYYSPFSNTGNRFDGKVFQAHAYSWNEEDDQPWNFKWKDLEVSWYKYLGRGTTANREVKPDEIAVMLDECLASLDEMDVDL